MPTKTTAVQKGNFTVRKNDSNQPVKRKTEKYSREVVSTDVVREMARKIALEHRRVFEELAK